MKRIELFEFEDFHWLPQFIRSGITNLIMVLHRMIGTSQVLADIITDIRAKVSFDQIVDMGSGSGGAMISTIKKLNQSKSPEDQFRLLLTDMFPNEDVIKRINDSNHANITYVSESLNATNLRHAPQGLKTMVASFHHMSPDKAKQILNSAQSEKQAILIYEIAKNNIPTLLWWILLPLSLLILILMSMVMTLFVRPLSPIQLLFTFLIPIIPIIYAWDGQASLMRTYTEEDIKTMIADIQTEAYTWEIADAIKSNGKKAGYYIVGRPT